MTGYETGLVMIQQQNPELIEGGAWLGLFGLAIICGFWLLSRS